MHNDVEETKQKNVQTQKKPSPFAFRQKKRKNKCLSTGVSTGRNFYPPFPARIIRQDRAAAAIIFYKMITWYIETNRISSN